MKTMPTFQKELMSQLTLIDKAQHKKEIDSIINTILQLLAEQFGADHAYFFDNIEPEQGMFFCTLEWCAPKMTTLTKDNLSYHEEDIPTWFSFLKDGEPIFIPNVEAIKDNMPEEYEVLSSLNIHSTIAFPVFYHSYLGGFIGLDNATITLDDAFTQVIEFIGRHIGTARANLTLIKGLKHERAKLKDNLYTLEMEKQILMALSQESTSVYLVDLKSNRGKILKADPNSHAASLINTYKEDWFPYTQELYKYFSLFTKTASTIDFLDAFDPENLMKILENTNYYSYNYRLQEPNEKGELYYEIRASKIEQTEENFKVVVDFRCIDAVVKQEVEHNKRLEAALEETRLSNEVIAAISKIYHTIYRVNLVTHHFEEISSREKFHDIIGSSGETTAQMSPKVKDGILPEYLPFVEKFFNLDTLNNRLQDDETIVIEYPTEDGNWQLARFIVQTRDEQNNVVEVLLVMRLFSEEKRREKYWINRANEATQANKAKSDFLSRMSHDMRTPMNVIMGFTNLALQNINNPKKVEDYLRKLLKSGDSLHEIIDDILDISKIENGKFIIHPAPMSVNDLVTYCSQSVTGMAENRDLEFTTNIHDITHDILFADKTRIQQVLINLLSNAVKYTFDGGSISLEIFEEPAEDNENVRIVFIVSDTGIGMTKEFTENMFNAFTREIDTRINKVQGTGLGLAITKRIVDFMQGTIEVETEPQKGSTFTVCFELPVVAQDSLEEEKTEEKPFRLPEKPLNILVAEDNDLNYEVTEELLSNYKISCKRAIDGQDCVEKYKVAKPDEFDAILMDMQMPRMNGLEATVAIRNLPKQEARRIPIVALTANAYWQDAQQCLGVGMDAHLAKPLDVQHAVNTIVECVDSAQEKALKQY